MTRAASRSSTGPSGLVGRVEQQPAGAAWPPRLVGRLLSAVEDGSPQVPALMRRLAGAAVQTPVLGITGAPGVGKSTLVTALVGGWRAEGLRVGVLAVDPSSPYSGGAVLGDRVRMQAHATDTGVYIRSMASRGHLGGLTATTPQAVRVLAAAGADVVVVETVGVGQSEVDVAAIADTTVVVLAPGLGDAVQAAKAGILEIADVYAVNKADRDGARNLIGDVRGMLTLIRRPPGAWRQPVVPVVSTDPDGPVGVRELREALESHRHWLDASDHGRQRRQRRARAEIESVALAGLRRRLLAAAGDRRLDALAQRVADGDMDAFTAADQWAGTQCADQPAQRAQPDQPAQPEQPEQPERPVAADPADSPD